MRRTSNGEDRAWEKTWRERYIDSIVAERSVTSKREVDVPLQTQRKKSRGKKITHKLTYNAERKKRKGEKQ